MQIGIVGLGRMGGGIAKRLMKHGHTTVVFDQSPDTVGQLAAAGATGTTGLEDLVAKLDKPRTVWVMLPSGKITEDTISALGNILEAGDLIIDGGNSFYKDDIRRAKTLTEKGIDYVDIGTSGGVWGLERGFCMMVGGPDDQVTRIDPILVALAPGMGDTARTKDRKPDADPRPEQGYIHAGPAGAGHFVKMVHNGIEYGLMQAYAEGFDVLKNKDSKLLPEDMRYTLNVTDIAEVWRRGSVISSWLLDLSADALAENGELSDFTGKVADSGEGQWTVDAAMEEAVPAYVLTTALLARYRSRSDNTFGEKMLSAMRAGFGGHKEPK